MLSQDMLWNVPLIAEWKTTTHNQDVLNNVALLKSSQLHIIYDYCVGQKALKHDDTIKGKLMVKISGPFEIIHVHMNATISIQLRPGVTDGINICYIIPYKDPLIYYREETVVPIKSITLIIVTWFLEIPRFLIPSNIYHLLIGSKQ